MSDDIYGRLSARFETHKKVNKGGGDQTYVPAFDVIDRLNTELGVFGWSFRVVREGFTATEAWVLGELTATRDGATVVRQQYGNEPITMGRSEKATADLLKKAGTDALKKCATLIGVAAYLYDEDERREVEAEMREQQRGGTKPAAKPTPINKPAGPKPDRDGLIRAYREAAQKAIDAGHKKSADLIANKPEDMSDEKLMTLGDMLTKWLAQQQRAS